MAKANFGSTLRALLRLLSPAPGQVAIEAITLTETCLEVRGHVVADTAVCPRCGTCSRRVHSRALRTLADLPCCGVPVQLSLRVRRFFCDASACMQRTFVERVPAAAAPYARRTTRLRTTLVPIAFAVGGKPGAAVLRHLHLRAGRDTLLRLIRRTCQGSSTGAREDLPRVVGVDDWAWRRGSRYGTIVCDLECRRPLDLLPDREVASTSAWLAAHPGITVVSRDRGGAYADAARQGAPEAVQVADRWHLLKNLGDALEGFLRRERVQLPSATGHSRLALAATLATGELTAAAVRIASETPGAPDSTAATVEGMVGGTVLPSRRQERFLQVHARQQTGVSIRAIAQEFGMARNTVRRYLRATQCPDWQRGRRHSRLDAYRAQLLRRWAEGCQNGSQLFRELREAGYRGGGTQVSVFVARLRERLPETPLTTSLAPPRPPSPRELRWLLARRPDELEDEEQAPVQELLAAYPSVATAYPLVQRFGQMVRARQVADLDGWLADAASSAIAEFGGFVLGIRRDRAAVEAGLTLAWSQGQVEGQITRLKLLKRQMYGRAKFDLLRQRFLYRSEVA